VGLGAVRADGGRRSTSKGMAAPFPRQPEGDPAPIRAVIQGHGSRGITHLGEGSRRWRGASSLVRARGWCLRGAVARARASGCVVATCTVGAHPFLSWAPYRCPGQDDRLGNCAEACANACRGTPAWPLVRRPRSRVDLCVIPGHCVVGLPLTAGKVRTTAPPTAQMSHRTRDHAHHAPTPAPPQPPSSLAENEPAPAPRPPSPPPRPAPQRPTADPRHDRQAASPTPPAASPSARSPGARRPGRRPR
jgi:hypothetical protein